MKVLWLTNLLMPDMATALGRSPSPRQGWMPALADALVESTSVELAVATAVQGQSFHKEIVRNVKYYAFLRPKGNVDGNHLPLPLIENYRRVIEDFRPDVIHIHGTEFFQGLLTGRGLLECPTVISIQGIIDVCEKHYWGNIPFIKILMTRTLRDWVRLDGLIEQKLAWKRRAKWEQEIFARNQAFLGRTLWDKAHTRRLNPEARYYHCDELLRQPFYDVQWNIDSIKRHSIFTSSAGYPLKGFHILVKAVALLRQEFPDISIRTPRAYFYSELSGLKRLLKNQRSTGYARYLTELVRREGMQNHIVPFDSLDASEMANELKNAHVFALPSLIENSSNALAESMLVGTPAVASYVGGIPSMARDDESALFFPPDDEAVLAEQIRRIFLDDDLACRLSNNASAVARIRHSKDRIVKDMLKIYEQESQLQS